MSVTTEPCYKNLIKCPVCQDHSYLTYPCNNFIGEMLLECPNCSSRIKIIIHKNKDTYEIFQDKKEV